MAYHWRQERRGTHTCTDVEIDEKVAGEEIGVLDSDVAATIVAALVAGSTVIVVAAHPCVRGVVTKGIASSKTTKCDVVPGGTPPTKQPAKAVPKHRCDVSLQ